MFKNIKEGDMVMYPLAVRVCQFERYPERFWVPVKVVKTTPKRFTLPNNLGTYSKVDGSNISKADRWSPENPRCKPVGEVEDQSDARVEFILTIKARKKVRESSFDKLTLEQCETILSVLKEEN